MKRAAISMDMLAIIIIVIIGMAIFIVFFTSKSGDMFKQFGHVSPEEDETARDACQLACNNAKLRTTCDSFNDAWCYKRYGNTEKMCYSVIECKKFVEEAYCEDCVNYLES